MSEIEGPGQLALAVVPDGVVRVKWVFTGAGVGILDPRPVTVYPRVKDNIAIAQLSSRDSALAQATWYDATGRVVAVADGGKATANELAFIRNVNHSRYHRIASRLKARFAPFRTLTPALPRDPQIYTGGIGGGPSLQLNYCQTRHITDRTGVPPSGLWVVPGTHGVCFADAASQNCKALPGAITNGGIYGGLLLAARDGGYELACGLVPNGNRSATLVFENGVLVKVPIIDHNLWLYRADQLPVSIIDRGLNGRYGRYPLPQFPS